MWQPYTSCSYSPTGSITIGTRELEPDPMYMKEMFCHDIFLESAYEHMIEYATSGNVDLTPEGTMIFNQLIDELLANAAYGFRITAATGQLYNVDSVSYSPENTANITDLFKRTHGTIKGWLKLAKDLAAAEYPWMDLPVVAPSDFDATGSFTGNILDLLDELKANARGPLRQLINRGGIVQQGRFSFYPLVLVSTSYFNAIVDRYNFESTQVATNRTRITMREFGGETSPTPQRVYYLDGMLPILPVDDVNGFDPYLAGDTHFCGIVASGNIQIGASFTSLPQDVENNDMGVLIARDNDPVSNSFGQYAVLSHALAKTAIADPNYFVGAITHTTPA